MKFTNGYWHVRPEFKPDFVGEIYELEQRDNELVAYAPYKKINVRGDILNAGMMTITVSAPMEDALRIRMQNHIGGLAGKPEFGFNPMAGNAVINIDGEVGSIASGDLKLEVRLGSPELEFTAKSRRLTRTKAKDTAIMHGNDGKSFVVTGLELDVGELVYGLGERFTHYVKNGQCVDTWNEDGGTSSEISYKNIPFYMTNRGYGVLVNHSGKVSFEAGSEKVQNVQFSVEDEELEYILIYGPTPKEILSKYTALTGRATVPPKWSFGLWLTTSFTTKYDEETVNGFIDGMHERNIPLRVFHFDCFWMKGFEWCSFQWDKAMFPDPEGMLRRLHSRGLKICVWINPYIAQKSPLFREGMEAGYLLKKENGRVWQWDMWQAGMGLVDFTNPDAWKWYQDKLKVLLDMGVDCFKTDFGERIPTDVKYFDGSNPEKMHNYYTYMYNNCVFELLEREFGKDEAVVFARSATVGGQKFPIHWGGDSTSQYVSMAESLRGGLSLMDSGFAFWSHDIGGFEDNGPADLYKRWVAFGMLSSHSRLHGSSSYRVPWNYDEEACGVLRFFTNLKCRLMPYLYTMAVRAHLSGVPVMRPMHVEFPDDKNCAYLDRQYMLGNSLLIAPVFSEDSAGECYLPDGAWTHLLTGETLEGGRWHTAHYDYFSLPVFVRENSIIPFGSREDVPDYDYEKQIEYRVYNLKNEAKFEILKQDGSVLASIEAKSIGGEISFSHSSEGCSVLLPEYKSVPKCAGCEPELSRNGLLLHPAKRDFTIFV